MSGQEAPARVKLVTSRDAIKDALSHFRTTYGRDADSDAAWKRGWTKRQIIDALAALDPETCSADEVRAIIGVPSWATLECDLCNRDVPELLRIGEEPDYEARWQDICRDCVTGLDAFFLSPRARHSAELECQ